MATKTITACSVGQVRRWIETTPHHKAAWSDDSKFFTLSGHFHTLKIPLYIYKKCHICGGDNFDSRMYRWDYYKEHVAVDPNREARLEFFEMLMEKSDDEKTFNEFIRDFAKRLQDFPPASNVKDAIERLYKERELK